jgi:hypothetical protein
VSGWTPVELGEAKGWQTVEEGSVGGASVTNAITSFSFKQPGETDDGSVILIAPSSQLNEAKRFYEAFLRSLRFGR